IALKQTSAGLSEQLSKSSGGVTALNQAFASTNEKLTKITEGLEQIRTGQSKLQQGVEKLEAGAGNLEAGIAGSSVGQKQVLAGLPQMSSGLSDIQQGQIELNNGLNTLETNFGQLQAGLGDSVSGLTQVSAGLAGTENYLSEIATTQSADSFFIPEEVRTGAEFAESLNQYMSKDRNMTKWTIILAVDPYSNEAITIMNEIKERYSELVKGTEFEHAPYGVAGTASQNSDLNTMSTGDFAKTAIIMLAGILIVLFVIIRSFWIPVSIIASLLLAYYTSLSMTELIFRTFTKHSELTWTTPFFSFIMIVALGVDYSIFLMMRYREHQAEGPRQAIQAAMKHTGAVIVSAVLILSGTFAAMYPSGLLTLTQLATVVIIALLLLMLVYLPLFLPALITIIYRKKA
ncbi:MAG: MMPL family transporter, partial [Gorillibacterium sp.]|nr:MMPL family transporter [Gorillibacterium sp.]